ncbi:prenyltransferase/squalene oxidase repeat-containing protein [Solidesulfovibrio sp.]
MPLPQELLPYIDALLGRAGPDGAFAVAQGSGTRPDATAWAAMALFAAGQAAGVVAAARAALAAGQLPDGRVPVLPERPEAAWPTTLAVLAWRPDPAFAAQADKAAAWLVAHPGTRWKREDATVVGHDTSLAGWTWIDGTHSWVEPTSLAMLALSARPDAPRAALDEATRLLLDRQLPDGGWNYGNTRVFRNTLLPVPESTGHALTALGGRAGPEAVAASLAYLAGPQCAAATPLAASWRAFGLGAYGLATPDIVANCLTALGRQDRFGPYDTPQLAQLIAAVATAGRFAALLGDRS